MKTIYEDNDILVLDKPSGVVVNRSDTYEGDTVQDFIEKESAFLQDTQDALDLDEVAEENLALSNEFMARSGIVHRLDKDTSGVLLIAKNPDVFFNLQNQFKSREVNKEYHAICLGSATVEKFEVDAPLGRNPKNRLIMAVVPDGREARTSFELVKVFEVKDVDGAGTNYSYIKAFPATGRTHQIRVHLAALNLPIASDPIYCSKAQLVKTNVAFTRMMLHALSIEFTHPVTHKKEKMVSELPQEFSKYL